MDTPSLHSFVPETRVDTRYTDVGLVVFYSYFFKVREFISIHFERLVKLEKYILKKTINGENPSLRKQLLVHLETVKGSVCWI